MAKYDHTIYEGGAKSDGKGDTSNIELVGGSNSKGLSLNKQQSSTSQKLYGTALNDLQKQITKMTSKYDPENADKSLKTEGVPMAITEMVKRMATPMEKVLFWFAIFIATLSGAAVPAFAFVFGTMIDSAGKSPDMTLK